MANFNYLYTKQGKELNSIPWNIYPRPLLKRNSFFCLNGKWDFEISNSSEMVYSFSKIITVPFCPESLLSGVNMPIPDKTYLFYKTQFTLPKDFINNKVILHFGAADNFADIFLNGEFIGSHTGGYFPFSFDITNQLKETNTLIVRTYDDLSNSLYPYGKQKQKRGGMWYTPVSGIWQTVWIESVPNEYIKNINTEITNDGVTITAEGCKTATVTLGDNQYKMENGVCKIKINSPIYWSPENPHLYHFKVTTEHDTVESYFAFRTLEIKEIDGVSRLFLNGKPYYFHGILDQGYFSDGLFTPASLDCFTEEITRLKNLGFNMLRKHIKIEPQLFYYECDRLGMVVFQDMVNNGKYSFFKDTALPTINLKRKNDKNLHNNKKQREIFIDSMKETVKLLKNHPCICEWTIFNEGWGQFDSSSMYDLLKSIDNTRFIDSASGWFKGGKNDFSSHHIYFKKYKFKPSNKPVSLSEFGGYAFAVKNHLFNPEKSFGYKSLKSKEELNNAITKLYFEQVIPAINKGLCADVYTQVSDVEDEINGLFTYDRKVIKVSKAVMQKIANEIFKNIN